MSATTDWISAAVHRAATVINARMGTSTTPLSIAYGAVSDAVVVEEIEKTIHAVECGCAYDGEHTHEDIARRETLAHAIRNRIVGEHPHAYETCRGCARTFSMMTMSRGLCWECK